MPKVFAPILLNAHQVIKDKHIPLFRIKTAAYFSGCGKDGFDCAREGLKWRSADLCVDASDCTCASKSGSIVKVQN